MLKRRDHKGNYEHQGFRFLQCCPVCSKQYNEHWKVVNHIRKTHDERHRLFLTQQEQQFFDVFTNSKRQELYENLFAVQNIFCGSSFTHANDIINKFLSKLNREQNRISRISRTLSGVPKTPEHAQKVSKAVSQSWANGLYNTPTAIAARKQGYARRRSFSGSNNPMFGKPSPRGSGRGKGGIRSDIGHYVRSTWEANICRIYQLMSRSYEYEKRRFEMVISGKKYTYCPDIYNPKTDRYYEIKGHAKSARNWQCQCKNCIKNKRVISNLRKDGVHLTIIGKNEYLRFKRKFQHRINWEK